MIQTVLSPTLLGRNAEEGGKTEEEPEKVTPLKTNSLPPDVLAQSGKSGCSER
jgi:hypothetical protein